MKCEDCWYAYTRDHMSKAGLLISMEMRCSHQVITSGYIPTYFKPGDPDLYCPHFTTSEQHSRQVIYNQNACAEPRRDWKGGRIK